MGMALDAGTDIFDKIDPPKVYNDTLSILFNWHENCKIYLLNKGFLYESYFSWLFGRRIKKSIK